MTLPLIARGEASPKNSRIGVAVLGSTGSIGCSTLDVLARHAERFEVVALTAHANTALLIEQCKQHRPRFAVIGQQAATESLQNQLTQNGLNTKVLVGPTALEAMAAHVDVDYVMAAIVGAAGLKPTLAAARSGKRVLLANKEALVMSGPLFMQAVTQGGGSLIPIDSEHNAIYQCLPGGGSGQSLAGVRKIVLTASGGPFLRTPAQMLASVTPDQACAHPRWSMGRKISVDSATLMNKGLELIEASLLFGLPPSRIEIMVHPQSIVHSMVEYLDGSTLAQMGNPDMRVPIAHALGCPERLHSGVESLDLVRLGRLDFEAPDEARFPSLRLARAAAEAGGTAPAALNAANEIAVEAFLTGRLAFTEIVGVIGRVMDSHTNTAVNELSDVLNADAWARERASAMLVNV